MWVGNGFNDRLVFLQEEGKGTSRAVGGQSSSGISHPKPKSKQSSLRGSSGSTSTKGSVMPGFPKKTASVMVGSDPSNSSIDVQIFSLVGEVTRSKDETIASKNYTIQLLEKMLQNRAVASCAACGT